MKKFVLIFFLFLYGFAHAQETFPINGSSDKRPHRYAFINAKIIIDSYRRIESGIMLVNEDRIEEVGDVATIEVPKGYIVIDLKGKYIYPAFVDAYSSYGVSSNSQKASGLNNVFVSTKPGAYGWNEAIKAETKAHYLFQIDKQKAKTLRNLGFGAVNSIVKDGIVRGTSVLVTLNDDVRDNEVVLKQEASTNYSFDKGSAKTDYPSSLMGSIALLRQTYYDARWYERQNKEYNITLSEFNKSQNLPQIFEAKNFLDVLRADKIGDEFGTQYVFKTSGDEYKRIEKIKATRGAFIVSVNFPKPFDVSSLSAANAVSVSQLKEWELAPTNLATLEKANIRFAITSADIENGDDFWKNIRLAVKNGLSETKTIRALTTEPAEMLGVFDKIGSLEEGKYANFIITSSNILDEDNVIYENWIKGIKYKINEIQDFDLRGNFEVRITGVDSAGVLSSLGKEPLLLSSDTVDLSLKIGGTLRKHTVSIAQEVDEEDSTVVKQGIITKDKESFNISVDLAKPKGMMRLSGYISSFSPLVLQGSVVYPDGSKGVFSARYKSLTKETSRKEPVEKIELGKVVYPFVAYGTTEESKPVGLLVLKHATVWTSEKDGTLYDTDVIIEGGKIKEVGKALIVPPGAKVINLKGKHITPGIVDEHSHIAISGEVNEASKAVTSEVSIESVINSEDINIYRQLAGGVTVAHLLHGSANPIGGQSALIKLRWGKSPEELKFEERIPFIKFALGENVKQSNWGDSFNQRFPQTRMGVEQVYIDAFMRAREYQAMKESYEQSYSKKLKKYTQPEPRKDLSLEPLVDILNERMNITCHSYVQSEINMLISLSDSIGFKINTFTHILEGYKLADKLKARKIAASTFSDWWAYKSEVVDAIPYNAYLLRKAGVLTAINSDDPEMGRRLNQEAAKTMKYGGLSEVDALKLITINPAKMLHIQDRVGSIAEGKDADVVIWSGHPLSVYSKVEKTFIEGVLYYDSEQDVKLKRDLEIERNRIIKKMVDATQKGSNTQSPFVAKTNEGSDDVFNHAK